MGNSNKTWEIGCFSNSDFAGDLVSRRSTSGFILYVLGVTVSWQSKSQNSGSLTSSEVEYVALSEAVKEVMFVLQLLGSMKIAVNNPVTVRVDKIGAIFMSSNITTTCHKKHVDIRDKYVNEYVEDGVVMIVFVKSAENDCDILTKNYMQSFMRSIQRRWWVRNLEMFLASKIFEVEIYHQIFYLMICD